MAERKAKSLTDIDRRKFKGPTSDSMVRWKGRGGKRQRQERKKKKIRERQKTEDPGPQKGNCESLVCSNVLWFRRIDRHLGVTGASGSTFPWA